MTAPSRAVWLALAASATIVGAQSDTRGRDSRAPAPNAWERPAGTSFAHRGLARIERINTRWALTVLCHGQHSTYLEPGDVDHVPLADRYVQARYHYVDVASAAVCVRGPCPPASERRLVLERADPLSPPPTEPQLQNALDRCQPESGWLR